MKKINKIIKGTLCGREFPSYPQLRLTEILVIAVNSETVRQGKKVKRKVFPRPHLIEVWIEDTSCLPDEIKKNLFQRGWEIKLHITGDKSKPVAKIVSITERRCDRRTYVIS